MGGHACPSISSPPSLLNIISPSGCCSVSCAGLSRHARLGVFSGSPEKMVKLIERPEGH